MFDVIVDMSSVRKTFIPDIFLHQCCQHSFHNLSVKRQKAKPDKKNIRDNLPHTQTHKHTHSDESSTRLSGEVRRRASK